MMINSCDQEKSRLPFFPEVASRSLSDFGARYLRRLTSAYGFGQRGLEAVQVLRTLMDGWGQQPIRHTPAWFSDVCADGSPIEFSVVYGAGQRPEVRVLIEALSEEPTLAAMQTMALETTELLEREWNVDLQRFRAIQDIFLPRTPQGHFAIMHAVSFWADKAPEFKVYLNPGAQGEDTRAELVAEALTRLGFKHVWPTIESFGGRIGPSRLVYLSLDLSPSKDARVKIYFRHFSTDPKTLDQAMTIAPGHQPGPLAELCGEITDNHNIFTSQPLVSHLSFTDPSSASPLEATLYAPLWTYMDHDAQLQDRICRALARRNICTSAYETALGLLARRSLERGRGIQTYVGARFHRGRLRLTSYFSPELYSRAPEPRYQYAG